MSQPPPLKEILNVGDLIIQEINSEINSLIKQLEDLVEVSQEFPEFLEEHSEQLHRIDQEIVTSLHNLEDSHHELHQASLLKQSMMKIQSLFIGGGTGVLAGAITGSFFPVVGSVAGGCLGLIGGAAGAYFVGYIALSH